MKTITQSYLINAPVEKVWQALVDPACINAWGAGEAQMDDQVGSAFSLWDGDIHGTNTTVVAHKELVQDWYGGDWDQASKVTFTLTTKDNQTELTLLHENVPDSAEKDIDDGWKTYYLGPLKKYVETQNSS